MDDCRWWWWWCWADATARLVGTAWIVCRWLVPWTRWLGRLAACRCRRALSGDNGNSGDPRRRDDVSTCCTCCGGVDFDGMAGRWAVVTGCTDGIGKQYALQLADRGINVALVSRNPDKLRTVAEEIYKRHSGTVLSRTVVADFASHGNPLTETYDAVRRGLAGLNVALLINNAGVGYARPERLLDLPPSRSDPTAPGGHDLCRDIIECNVLAAVSMCRIAMPLMVDAAARDRRDDGDELPVPATARGGVVINVSSLLAQIPCPLITVYAATKAFLDKFSVELAAEYGGGATDAIAVRCLTPGLVSTKMTRIRATGQNTNMTPVPDASTYARHSLRSLSCHCWCRRRRRRRRFVHQRRNGAVDDGWLSAAIAVFDSPSSPFSTGHTGTTTAGHLSHTLMVRSLILIKWLMGDDIFSYTMRWILYRNRDRIALKEAKKAKAVAKIATKEEKEMSVIQKAQK